MTVQTCKTCTHFRQHYILDAQCCYTVACGHCVFPRVKHRSPDSPTCKHYTLQPLPANLAKREEVIQYLTVELLQYIFSLDLPPEIQE